MTRTIRATGTVTVMAGLLAGVARGELLQVGFEDLSLGAEWVESYTGPGGGGYYNGATVEGGFTSNGVNFENSFTDWGGGYYSWSGWAYSTTTDVETAGIGNQYSAFAGAAAGGSVFALTYAPSTLDLPPGWQAPQEISVTNSSYAGISMRDGDPFAKQFTSLDEDWFLLTLTGLDGDGQETGSVEVYLADFRAGAGYILDTWETVDLSSLGESVAQISFSLSSSDNGDWGMNTPSYVAVDNLVLGSTQVPEPGSIALLAGLGGALLVLRRRISRLRG